MPRLPVALVVVSFALASPLAAGAGSRQPDGSGATSARAATIVLRGRTGIQGPWRRVLRLRLVKGGLPVSFSLCAVWGERPSLRSSCGGATGERLPEGARLRLEQRRRAGWRRVGLSVEPVLQAVLSNAVAGNRFGTVSYRVRLLQSSGRVLRTSNTFRVIWHK